MKNITSLLEEIGAEDKGMMLCLINIYKEQTPSLIENIQKEVIKQDSIGLKNAAHTLKGTCLNIGFNNMSKICMDIEEKAQNCNFNEAKPLHQELLRTHAEICEQLNLLEKKAG